jgi:hypothetical protein
LTREASAPVLPEPPSPRRIIRIRGCTVGSLSLGIGLGLRVVGEVLFVECKFLLDGLLHILVYVEVLLVNKLVQIIEFSLGKGH